MRKQSKVFMAAIVIAVVVVLAMVILSVADRAFYRSFTMKSLAIKAGAGKSQEKIITEVDLENLPAPLARYMKFSGVIGKKMIRSVHATHTGRFKPGKDKPWMPINGEYYLAAEPPAFSWYGKINLVPGLSVVAFDSYADGKGRMLVKALSLLTLVDARSREVDLSAFGRCVAELTLAPTFYMNRDFVRCQQTGPDQLKCRMTDGHFSADAELFVNRDGSLEKIVVMRFYDRGGGKGTLERFTGKGADPKAYRGFVLPSKLDGYWNLSEGDFHYVSFEIDRIDLE